MSAVDKFYEWHKAELEYLEEHGPRKKRGRKPSKKQYGTLAIPFCNLVNLGTQF